MRNELKNEETHIQQKVEKIGVFFDKMGLTPMQGRVLAYLLLAEPPYKDFYEIQDFLKASKSAVSNALNSLMGLKIVDYLKFSGDRKRYFKINHEGWLNYYKHRIRQTGPFRDLVKEVLEARQNSQYPDFNDQLRKMLNFQTHIYEGLEQLIQDWEENDS